MATNTRPVLFQLIELTCDIHGKVCQIRSHYSPGKVVAGMICDKCLAETGKRRKFGPMEWKFVTTFYCLNKEEAEQKAIEYYKNSGGE